MTFKQAEQHAHIIPKFRTHKQEFQVILSEFKSKQGYETLDLIKNKKNLKMTIKFIILTGCGGSHL